MCSTVGVAAPTSRIVISKPDEVDRLDNCNKISAKDATSLPSGNRRKNVCFTAILYAGREYTVVVPIESSAAAIPSPDAPFSDGAITVSPPSDSYIDLSEFDGARVWVVGDLIYDRKCWTMKPTNGALCVPQKPIGLKNGTIVISPSIQ
jgi:hypothetical protein